MKDYHWIWSTPLFTWSSANWSTSSQPVTIESLLKLKRELNEKFGAPPPPADPRRCANCKRTIGQLTAHRILIGPGIAATPVFLCWRCIDALVALTAERRPPAP